jgi:sulfoxide reductase heme-binding subunit YedZ
MPFSWTDFEKTFARVWLKPIAFWLLALPGLWIGWQWIAWLLHWPNTLGFNPDEYTHHFLGETAIRLLLLALAVTPFRDWTGWTPIMRIRRRIGLFAFGYAFLHVLAYVGLNLRFSLPDLWADVLDRTYITFGMAAFVLLIPLAITSNETIIKKMSAMAWKRLHYAVYAVGVLAVTHHWFAEKGNQPGPWVHAGILAVLLGWRAGKTVGVFKPRMRKKKKKPKPEPQTA